MSRRRHTKLVREGPYAAEVEVELIDAENGWAPYNSPVDAGRLDEVREALRRGDVPAASRRWLASSPALINHQSGGVKWKRQN